MAIVVQKTRKEQITDLAAVFFNEKGYSATSLREVAAALGMTVSSLYSHYSNKEEILWEICYRNAVFFLEGIKDIPLDLCMDQQIEEIVGLHVTQLRQGGGVVLLFSEEWKHLSGDNLALFKAMRKDYEREIEQRLCKGFAGTEASGIAMRTFLSGLQWIYKSKRSMSAGQIKGLRQVLCSIFISGIKGEQQ
jgi:AcrR family transcriptional regulator